ncbi:hypothetical protein SAMN05216315_13229 [Nitrosospira sp. Nsp18]|uniref:hypothetical protein n=1 Tax=Nitrosospira sp. Nsp18 TaxID=1855334 RepID=UPI0008892769|nr:hypothetical protein [Nitrosospira sp. Nsp18]SDA27163.1 hypothetical protein SAMN05216315_13229 [Nitrosospira sp. Nsp18]
MMTRSEYGMAFYNGLETAMHGVNERIVSPRTAKLLDVADGLLRDGREERLAPSRFRMVLRGGHCEEA